MKDGAPFSRGKRRIIKGILERGRFPGRKKKFKKVPAFVLSDEDSCESAQSVASEKAENNRPITHKEKAFAAEKDSKSDTSTLIVNPDFNESHSFTVSKVDVDLTKSANILNITFDPCKNTVKDERNRDKDKGSLDIREKSEERNDVSSKMETCSQVTEVNEEIVSLSPELGRKACLNVEPVDITPDSTTSSPGSSDSEVLPSASFCGVSDGSRLSQRFSINTLNDILKGVEKRELKGISEHSSPVFGGKSDSNKALVNEEVDSNDLPEFEHSSNTNGKKNKKVSHIKSRNKFRFKRKLPKFSDSDSEDNFPEKKRQNVSAEKQSGSFTGNISTKRNCKEGKGLKGKLQISKDLFSNSKSSTAIQPTLSFFTKAVNKDKQKGVNNCVENTVQELPDIDNDHTPKMPDSPTAIDEADCELMQEIRSLSNVEELNQEHIRFLIERHRSYLVRIFEGKSHCARHEAYKQGGKSRRNLNHASRLGPYTDEQLDIVMECLMGIFCKKHHKYLDYIMKVLLQEILIKFHMEINNTTQEESDRKLAPGTPEQVSSSS